MPKKVLIFATGGTIAMKFDVGSGGVVPAVSGAELIHTVTGIDALCPVEVREFSNIPSEHMTPQKMFTLACAINEALQDDEVAGIVVTHGTDTMEETAYMLELMVNSDTPVVLTAAMRSASDLSPDGPKNILCAVKTACSKEARGLGTLVVLNEQIHGAREVTKTHSTNPDTFASPWWGPLGYVDEDKVIIRHLPAIKQHICPKALGGEVYLLKLTAGCDTLLFDTLIEKHVAGIVVEAFGRGNMPVPIEECLQRACAAKIPVVLTSRCFAGRVLGIYSYEGGGKSLQGSGAIFTEELSGQKARIKLMLALGITQNPKELAEYFSL